MRSNICYLFDENGMEDVLNEVEKTAKYCELNHRQLLHLRVLSEELTGLLNCITGDYEAKFWIQTNYNVCEIHIELEFLKNEKKKKRFMGISNSEVKSQGLIEKVCELIEENIIEKTHCKNDKPVKYSNSMTRACYKGRNTINWSFAQYLEFLEEMNEADELEYLEESIVAKLADDVRVKISANRAEVIIKKIFK